MAYRSYCLFPGECGRAAAEDLHLRQVGENYEVAAVIEGSGNAIDSIYYENLDDSPSKELIVDWETAGQSTPWRLTPSTVMRCLS